MLELNKYIKGQCFICKQKTQDPEAYVHTECAYAYSDDKNRRIRESQDKTS